MGWRVLYPSLDVREVARAFVQAIVLATRCFIPLHSEPLSCELRTVSSRVLRTASKNHYTHHTTTHTCSQVCR